MNILMEQLAMAKGKGDMPLVNRIIDQILYLSEPQIFPLNKSKRNPKGLTSPVKKDRGFVWNKKKV